MIKGTIFWARKSLHTIQSHFSLILNYHVFKHKLDPKHMLNLFSIFSSSYFNITFLVVILHGHLNLDGFFQTYFFYNVGGNLKNIIPI